MSSTVKSPDLVPQVDPEKLSLWIHITDKSLILLGRLSRNDNVLYGLVVDAASKQWGELAKDWRVDRFKLMEPGSVLEFIQESDPTARPAYKDTITDKNVKIKILQPYDLSLWQNPQQNQEMVLGRLSPYDKDNLIGVSINPKTIHYGNFYNRLDAKGFQRLPDGSKFVFTQE